MQLDLLLHHRIAGSRNRHPRGIVHMHTILYIKPASARSLISRVPFNSISMLPTTLPHVAPAPGFRHYYLEASTTRSKQPVATRHQNPSLDLICSDPRNSGPKPGVSRPRTLHIAETFSPTQLHRLSLHIWMNRQPLIPPNRLSQTHPTHNQPTTPHPSTLFGQPHLPPHPHRL